MPDTPSTTLIHYLPSPAATVFACGATAGNGAADSGGVTCFACRNTPEFRQDQLRVGGSTPLKLSGIMADDEHLTALAEKAKAYEWLASMKNDRDMFTIQEVIHHGDYRSIRRVEVYAINDTTVDAVLQSSAYCYGSWLHAEPQYAEHRRAALKQLVDDLKHGRENRAIGWSTFRLTK